MYQMVLRTELIIKYFGLFSISEDNPLCWVDDNGFEYKWLNQEDAKAFLENFFDLEELDICLINPIFALRTLVNPNGTLQYHVEYTNLVFNSIFDALNYMCIWQEVRSAKKLLGEMPVSTRAFRAMVRYVRDLEFAIRVIQKQCKKAD